LLESIPWNCLHVGSIDLGVHEPDPVVEGPLASMQLQAR
jgi:hypothetical protein